MEHRVHTGGEDIQTLCVLCPPHPLTMCNPCSSCNDSTQKGSTSKRSNLGLIKADLQTVPVSACVSLSLGGDECHEGHVWI